MKKLSIVLALVLVVAMAIPASAAVEELTAGGSIVIRGQTITPGFESGFFGGPFSSIWASDDNPDLDWITQRTRVNVDAKMTGGVRAFVELQSYDFWGVDLDDFELGAIDPMFPLGTVDSDEQKNYGFFGGQGDDNINLYQAYIEMNDIGDYPLQVRVGRQELVYGREWIVGNNDAGINFAGLAFDALKVSYNTDMFQIDAWYSKLADLSSPQVGLLLSPVQQDADIDFYGVYGTYKGIENMAIDAYWMLVRNADTVFSAFDTKDVDYLHTVGGRVAGGLELAGGMLDYNVEAAFQFGSNNVPEDFASNDSGDYKGWAFNAMAGYTFDAVAWTPRLEAEYAFFSGDDDANDGDTEEFVRLFSDVHYGELNLGQNLDQATTNLHIVRVGASAVPVEKLTISGDLYWFLLAEDDVDGWGKTFGIGQFSSSPDDDPGIEVDLAASYQYTEDLNLRAGWAHFFVGDAFENSYGFDFDDGTTNDDDIDYLYVQASLTF